MGLHGPEREEQGFRDFAVAAAGRGLLRYSKLSRRERVAASQRVPARTSACDGKSLGIVSTVVVLIGLGSIGVEVLRMPRAREPGRVTESPGYAS